MRAIVFALGVSAALLAASPAQAQFANRSIGIGAGYLKLNQEGTLDWGVPVGLFYSQYWDAGFEGVARFYGMLLTEPVSGKLVIGIQPQLGVRYLFAQENIRPYVEVNLSYFHVFYDQNDLSGGGVADYVGPGAALGIDFFLSDNLSLGLRAQYNLYIQLNVPLQSSLGGTVELATYF